MPRPAPPPPRPGLMRTVASRRAMVTASWLDTRTTSSSSDTLSTLGMKPAPMPWICGREGGEEGGKEGGREGGEDRREEGLVGRVGRAAQ